ncbi:MAG: hypothetical protein K1X75_11230 [Leptospirales bacterium]|nr:hypothetical protein [Leptospirales bacterium]
MKAFGFRQARPRLCAFYLFCVGLLAFFLDCSQLPVANLQRCHYVPGISHLQDLIIDRSSGGLPRLLLSVQNTLDRDPGGQLLHRGMLLSVPLNTESPDTEPLQIENRDDWPFHPAGIAIIELRARDGWLYVLNQALSDLFAVELYRIQGNRLQFIDRIRSRMLDRPREIIAIAKDQFIVLQRDRSIFGGSPLLLFYGATVRSIPLNISAPISMTLNGRKLYVLSEAGDVESLDLQYLPAPPISVATLPGQAAAIALRSSEPGQLIRTNANGLGYYLDGDGVPLSTAFGDPEYTRRASGILRYQNRIYIARNDASGLAICQAP